MLPSGHFWHNVPRRTLMLVWLCSGMTVSAYPHGVTCFTGWVITLFGLYRHCCHCMSFLLCSDGLLINITWHSDARCTYLFKQSLISLKRPWRMEYWSTRCCQDKLCYWSPPAISAALPTAGQGCCTTRRENGTGPRLGPEKGGKVHCRPGCQSKQPDIDLTFKS